MSKFGWDDLKEVKLIARPEDVDTADVDEFARHIAAKKKQKEQEQTTEQKEEK